MLSTCKDDRQGCWGKASRVGGGGWLNRPMLNNTLHKCWDGICLVAKKDNKLRVVHTICFQLCLVLHDGKNTQKQWPKPEKVASRFIGSGEQPRSSADALPLWQFNRCHSFCHIKARRGRRRAATRDCSSSLRFSGCRSSRSFPTWSRTSGIQSCCFYWPWTFNLFCWPFTSELWTTHPGPCAVC